MKIVTSIDELREARRALKNPLGFVPTMGYLHEGHLSLVRQAREDCVSVAASIFVNPTQFGPSEDLENYPRDLERDFDLLRGEGTDLVWVPTQEEIYPAGYQTWVMVEELTSRLEGAHRPGHFRGVTTVVAKLFNAVQPEYAYFGQKDAQQAIVIQRMVSDLNLPVEIRVQPTLREPDGLAMSSRNTYLNADEREAATVLCKALSQASAAYQAGTREADTLRKMMSRVIESEPLAEEQYVSVADLETLEEIEGPVSRALLSMAVFVGKTRLIDNVILGE